MEVGVFSAVEVALHDLFDDRPEIAVLPLETALILRNEALKMVEQDPVEDGSLRSARTIDSRK
jgi:hypothetical protein